MQSALLVPTEHMVTQLKILFFCEMIFECSNVSPWYNWLGKDVLFFILSLYVCFKNIHLSFITSFREIQYSLKNKLISSGFQVWLSWRLHYVHHSKTVDYHWIWLESISRFAVISLDGNYLIKVLVSLKNVVKIRNNKSFCKVNQSQWWCNWWCNFQPIN